MNLIDSIAVEGFWGDRQLSLTLHDDVSFLIGPNGSGKTTLINLVAATLNADFLTLDRMPFTKITVTLKEVNGRKKPSITVEKEARTNLPFPSIRYSIRDAASAKAEQYSLEELEEQMLFRDRRFARRRLHPSRRGTSSVVEHLTKLVNVSWLSIHRTTLLSERGEDTSYESTVDKKLDDISNQFVRYFSV